MDLACNHEIVDHIAREPPVAAPPDGVQTATHTDERAQAAFALPDLFLPAPISTAAAANCRSRRICIEQLARNAPDLRIGETAHDSLNRVRMPLRRGVGENQDLPGGHPHGLILSGAFAQPDRLPVKEHAPRLITPNDFICAIR